MDIKTNKTDKTNKIIPQGLRNDPQCFQNDPKTFKMTTALNERSARASEASSAREAATCKKGTKTNETNKNK